jgi:hypothetical protein
MRLVATLAAVLFLATLQPGVAQQRAAKGVDKGAETTRVRDDAARPKPPVSATERDAAEARSRNEAKERAWDDKMKRTMRSICSGVTWC